MARALELAVKERRNGTGKNSWRDLQVPKVQVTREVRDMPPGKILKSGHLRVHFQHAGAKMRVFEQNTDSISNFGFFGSYFPRKEGGEFT